MLLRFSIDDVEKELPKLLIARAGAQRFHNVELQIAAETWAQFPVTREPKFIAVFAEMKIRHRADKADPLFTSRNLVVSGRTIGSKFRLWD